MIASQENYQKTSVIIFKFTTSSSNQIKNRKEHLLNMHVTFETRKSNAGVTFLSEDKNNKLKILSLNGRDLTEIGELASGR